MCLLFAGLVVCQLSVVKPVGQAVGRLYLTRFQSGFEPLIFCMPGYETVEVPIRRVLLQLFLPSDVAPDCVIMLVVEATCWFVEWQCCGGMVDGHQLCAAPADYKGNM